MASASDSTGLPVPGEAMGVLRPRGRPWVQVETAAASFGQGISVTNLQMAMAIAAVANGGGPLGHARGTALTTRARAPPVTTTTPPPWSDADAKAPRCPCDRLRSNR